VLAPKPWPDLSAFRGFRLSRVSPRMERSIREGNDASHPSRRHWVWLDNRGLEPPEPMIRTFGALGGLLEGQVIEIHNDRRPMFLYPHLEERGYLYQTVDEADGSASVRIWKPEKSRHNR